jgi:hypothetical protein
VVGQAEQGRGGRLDPAEERGHHAAQPVGACRQQQAPAERIDRGAAGDRRACQPAVHQRNGTQIGGDGQHHRDGLDLVEQGVRLAR